MMARRRFALPLFVIEQGSQGENEVQRQKWISTISNQVRVTGLLPQRAVSREDNLEAPSESNREKQISSSLNFRLHRSRISLCGRQLPRNAIRFSAKQHSQRS